MENNYTQKIKDVEITVSVVPTDAEPHAPKTAYCQAPDAQADANADLLNSAADLNVFDADYAIKIDYVHEFLDENTAAKIEVVDFYGKTIAEANIEKTTSENNVQVIFTFEKHPTGYFTVKKDGEVIEFYVVTPSLMGRTVEDSPFAMDTALTFLLRGKDESLFGRYSAAMRLTGVKWVRERLQWKDYQIAKNEDGSFEYDEEYLNNVKDKINVIKDAGLNVLMTYSTGPKWAVANARELPGSEISKGDRPNTLATYDTQLAIYDATKRIAERMDKQIDVIELINEPDHPAFRDLAEHYTSWFKSAALAVVDSGAENIKISMTGLCANPNDYGFVPIMLAGDVMKYCAVFNYHTHIYNHDFSQIDYVPDYGKNHVAREFPALCELYGIRHPSWISESGMKIPQMLPTEEQKAIQAPYAVTGAVQALSFGNDKYFWFVVAPYSEEGGDFSTFSGENKPYPVVAVYAVMTSVLGEAKFIGELKDLPSEDARGYLLKTGNGSETVAVVWMKRGKATYAVDPAVKVLDMMGQPVAHENGEVELSKNPVYLILDREPADYYKQNLTAHAPLKNPTFSDADYVLITPEFEGFTFSKDTKDFGHKIEDGMGIKVRVVNHCDVTVTGKVNVTIPAFTVSGIDEEITVQPHSEGFIPLTIAKNSDEDVADIITFTGVFNGKACTPTAASVYSGEQPDRKITRGGWNISFEKTLDNAAERLKSVTVCVNNFKGDESDVTMIADGEEFKSFKFSSDAVLDMDLSSLSDGIHRLSIAFRSRGGDLRLIPLNVRYDKKANTVVFANKR